MQPRRAVPIVGIVCFKVVGKLDHEESEPRGMETKVNCGRCNTLGVTYKDTIKSKFSNRNSVE